MSRGAEKTHVPLLMRDRSFYHTFLILAGTLILEQAVVLSVNLADNLMIGSYNETALAAVAAVNQIVFVVQQVIYGVTNGVIVLSSQYWGKQQTAPIRRLVCLGLRLEAALSMLFFAVVSLWPAQCVGLFVTGRGDHRRGRAVSARYPLHLPLLRRDDGAAGRDAQRGNGQSGTEGLGGVAGDELRDQLYPDLRPLRRAGARRGGRGDRHAGGADAGMRHCVRLCVLP